MRYLQRKFLLLITVILYGISRPMAAIKAVVLYAIKNPAQIIAPIGVLVCSGLIWATPEDSKLDPILLTIQAILIFTQFGSLIRTVNTGKIQRLKDDRERLKHFFESASTGNILGSVRFLSIYKDSWLRAWYYRLRGITRLSLYKYGDDDEVGSHTKFLVDTKGLFQLQLKGCIDTEDPDKAVEGLNFVAEHYLTK